MDKERNCLLYDKKQIIVFSPLCKIFVFQLYLFSMRNKLLLVKCLLLLLELFNTLEPQLNEPFYTEFPAISDCDIIIGVIHLI